MSSQAVLKAKIHINVRNEPEIFTAIRAVHNFKIQNADYCDDYFQHKYISVIYRMPKRNANDNFIIWNFFSNVILEFESV